ncbi:MAG: UDP-N-acetylglucosamine 2-epimerase (non-hydrolyzing) [Bacteroidota bacterium]
MHICTVVGARPQFVKAAAVSQAFQRHGVKESIVHTGQHYDANLAQVFFDELNIPPPVVNLDVRSGTHAAQTGAALVGIERFLMKRDVDAVLVYGDTNSTLAGALAAVKLGIPVAHVEAGLRSENMLMPEEVNRIATDRIATWLFCPTHDAVERLAREGITVGVHFSGDVMLEATRQFAARAKGRVVLDTVHPATTSGFTLATIHRPVNTDTPSRLQAIFDGLARLSTPVIMPVHPRTKARLEGIRVGKNVHQVAPVSYLTMLKLVQHAHTVVTDSGGVQKEAYWLETPCVTVRDETEWRETLAGGWNQLVGANAHAIVQAVQRRPHEAQHALGDAERPASDLIAEHLLSHG